MPLNQSLAIFFYKKSGFEKMEAKSWRRYDKSIKSDRIAAAASQWWECGAVVGGTCRVLINGTSSGEPGTVRKRGREGDKQPTNRKRGPEKILLIAGSGRYHNRKTIFWGFHNIDALFRILVKKMHFLPGFLWPQILMPVSCFLRKSETSCIKDRPADWYNSAIFTSN